LSLSNDVSYSVTLLDLGIRLRSGELAMRVDRGIDLRTVVGVVALILCSFTTPNAARAEDKTYVMKLGTATINESQHEWCKRFVAMVEKDSGGRIKGEIYPASQLGAIPRQLEGVQFGAIQGYVGPPEFLAGIDERYEVLSAPGLVADLAHEVRIVKDPELQKLMLGFGADKGIHGAALFIAQPSLVIARAPIAHLADFTGKKLRVFAADMQQEMIKSLGSSPVDDTGRCPAGNSAGCDRRLGLGHDGDNDDAFLGRRQICNRDRSTVYFLDGFSQQEMV
jgi:hypothetical protein